MLVLVVGPSGAGKDTLLSMAREALSGDPRFRFVRRVVTRPSGIEDNEAVSEAEFASRRFALQWQAHGLRYGIPADIIGDLGRCMVVVANVSRTVIAEAAERFDVRVILVTAPPAVLARRLAARSRESAEEIAERLSREVALPAQVTLDTVMNDGTPEQGADRFVAALIRAAPPAPPE